MSSSELLTPAMLDVVLPTLGFSLILNVILLLALLFKSFHRNLLQRLHVYWLGLVMFWRADKKKYPYSDSLSGD